MNQHGLADAGAAEQADLAALGVRREQIDDLDAGDENLRFGRLLGVVRRFGDGSARVCLAFTGPASSIGSPITLMMRPSRPSPTGTAIGEPVSVHLLAAHQAFGDVHRDGAHGRFAEMLRDFEHQAVAAVLGLERVQDRRQIAFELHVDDGADDLGDLADLRLREWPWCPLLTLCAYSASAPEMISISSFVIIA